jgi:hypothetical protein
MKEHNLLTMPDYLGLRFDSCPKRSTDGSFMNPPGVYDKDPTGFFSFRPQSAIEQFISRRD